MNLAAAEQSMRRFSNLIDQANDDYESHVEKHAAAERDYRKALAEAWLRAPRKIDGEKATVPERKAWVEGEVADLAYERDVAKGLLISAWGSIESRQKQLNAIQSLLSAHREEAKFARTGPEWS